MTKFIGLLDGVWGLEFANTLAQETCHFLTCIHNELQGRQCDQRFLGLS